MFTLHSLETAAKPFIQKTMVLSFSCAAVSSASRQALETLASLETHSGRCLVRRREAGRKR